MKASKAGYWLPRLLIIGFAASLVLPAPDFFRGLDDGQYTLWLARFVWVISIPIVFGAILLVIASLRRK